MTHANGWPIWGLRMQLRGVERVLARVGRVPRAQPEIALLQAGLYDLLLASEARHRRTARIVDPAPRNHALDDVLLSQDVYVELALTGTRYISFLGGSQPIVSQMMPALNGVVPDGTTDALHLLAWNSSTRGRCAAARV